jgi:sortase A
MVEPTRAGRTGDNRLWRVVGRVGEALIVLGVLLLLFVAYQLWGTGLQYSHSQDSLRSQFVAAAATTTTTAVAASTTTTTGPAPETTTTVSPAPTEGDTGTGTGDGDVVARLEIPRLDETAYVIAGVSVADLRKGPGHFPDSALPGHVGNTAIAGHRTTYGAPFADIDQLRSGDEVVLTTPGGERYVYAVSADPFVVPPDGVDVLADTPGQATLTLISCHPKYTARDRIVVRAALDAAASATPVAEPTPPPTAPPTTTADGGETSTTSPVITTSPTTVAPSTVLTSGWFSDHGAWVGVVLWGLALVATAVAAWWIGRGSRAWIGAVAMLVPALVFLYFFFENVNRLLPANL